MKRRVKRKVKKVFKVAIIICLVLGLAYIFYQSRKGEVKFSLKGNEHVVVNVFDKYEDAGYEALVCQKNCEDITDVQKEGNIDTSQIGEQSITYSLKYKGKKYTLKRTVLVVDNIAPTITLKGGGTSCLDNYQAYDNYDLDITSKVKVTKENNITRYSVTDSSGNTSFIDRVNTTDNTALKLNGKDTVYLEAGQKYEELGVLVEDNCKSDLTLSIEGNIDITKAGSYKLTYKIKNNSDAYIIAERNVKVYDFKTTDANLYWESLGYYIEDKGYSVSLGYKNILNNIIFKYNADKVYYGASLIKTLGALYSYEFLDVTNNSDLKYWVSKAISESDNASHKNIVNLIGINKLREYGKSLGATKVLDRGSNTDYFGNTWVNDQLIYMEYLYNFVNTNPLGEELKSYFINNHYNKVKYDGLPTVMHKYGYYDKYFHESAIILDDSPYIITILSEEAKRVVDNKEPIFQDLSEKLYNLNKLVSSK